MRFAMIMASAAVLSVAGAKALPAAPLAPVSSAPTVAAVHAPVAALVLVQDAGTAQPQPQTAKGDVKVDINTTTTRSWYADPFWIAIGVIALVVVVLLVAFAGRGGGTTTVVR